MQTTDQMEYQEWPSIYNHVKSHSYRSACTAANTYQSRLLNLLTPDMHQPTMLLKHSDHRRMLGELKLSYEKILDDLKMIDLDQLAYSVKEVFDRMCECMELYYNNVQLCVRRVVQQNGIHHARYVHQSKCSECHSNTQKTKIESMMSIMTLTTNEPSQQQLSALNQQISNLSSIYNSSSDIDLSAMIQQILKRKDVVLGAKNLRVNNIYEEIMQYLENIPQSTLNLSRDGGLNKICASEFNIGNFSDQLEQNFGKMLRNPIQKLIKRVLQYAKSLYCKQVSQQTIGTQTLMIKEDDNIKMLLKNNEAIKKQCDQLKKIRRETEKQMLKMMDNEQKNQIKISQITTENIFVHQRLQKANSELVAIKIKLQATEANRKQMSEKMIKDHTNERVQFMRSIRQLELKIEITDHELMRLRKQVQSSMVHECTQTNNIQFVTVEVQTQQRISFCDDNRNSYGNQSKKNAISKFAHNRRSDNNEGQQGQQEQKRPELYFMDNQVQNRKPRNKSRHSRLKAKLESSKSMKSIKSIKNLNINVDEDIIDDKNEFKRTQNKKTTLAIKKRQSIVQNLNEPVNEQLKISNDQPIIERRHDRKKYTQTTKLILKQKRYSGNARSQLNLRFEECIQNSKQREKDKELFSKQSDYKKFSPSNSMIRSRPKLQSSRMFVSKPHCSPYIGQGTYTPNGNIQSHWIDMLEINNVKRQNEVLKDTQNVEKIQFISKIIKKYSKLKECGLLNRINEIVSSKQLDEQSESGLENKNNYFVADEQEGQYRRLKKVKREGTHKTVVLKVPKQQGEQNINPNNKAKLLLGIKQVILVFGSVENAMKYELNIQIWAQLDHSLMIDNNFMSFCDHLEVFFLSLLKSQPELFCQISKFLTNPTAYSQLSKVSQPASREGSIEIKKNQLINHNRNLSHNPCPSPMVKRGILTKRNGLTNQTLSPHELRDIIHKLLRFHKISHRKCNHVQQFLTLVGFKERVG